MMTGNFSFANTVRQDPRFADEEGTFVVKLPFTTGEQLAGVKIIVKFTKGGVQGILKALQELVGGEHKRMILGIINYAIIQPDVLSNSEAEVLLFNGAAVSCNKRKRKRGHSTFGRSNQPLYEFAERVVRALRLECPAMVVDQFLSVKFFHFKGELIVHGIGVKHCHIII